MGIETSGGIQQSPLRNWIQRQALGVRWVPIAAMERRRNAVSLLAKPTAHRLNAGARTG